MGSQFAKTNRRWRWRFSLRWLFQVTGVVAVYSAAYAAPAGNTSFLLFLIATAWFFGMLGVGCNCTAWAGFSVGGVLASVFWWWMDTVEPFHPKDGVQRSIDLIILGLLVTLAGQLPIVV